MQKNRVIFAENLKVLEKINDETIDLIYIDPPFNTRRRQAREQDDGSIISYEDSFDNFGSFMTERLLHAHRILKPHGSLFIHLDWHSVHYVKIWTDNVFGADNFKNEIIWAYDYGARSKSRWSAKHDNILWYVKDLKNYTFNFEDMERIPYMAPGLVGPEKAARGKTPTDCYSEDTEVLTKNGWKLFKDVTMKDECATLNKFGFIVYQKPIKLHNYEYSGEMYQISHTSCKLLVTPNHNMLVRKKHSDNYELLPISKMKNQIYSIPQTADWGGDEIKWFYLPDGKRIKMDTWLEFFGWFISEGCLTYTKHNGSYRISISQIKEENRTKIENCLNKLGFPYHYNSHSYCLSRKILYDTLKPFGKAFQKYIPKEFLSLSKRQLSILFDSLMSGDGCYSGGYSYRTTSKQLADDVAEIAWKLGFNSTITENSFPNNENWKNSFNVYILQPKELHIFPKKHISTVPYSGNVYCVTVPNHTLFVRRKGKMNWCGNCWWHTIVPTNGHEKTGYPTQKPLGIVKRIVSIHSKPGDIVLDFFAGSGTTGQACIELGRNFILVDKNPQAIEVMRKRFEGKNVIWNKI